MAASIYQRLDPTKSEIRLLVLHSGQHNDGMKIECSLRVASLAEDVEFEALSYVWGDMSILEPISIDGISDFQVTTNLKAALSRLRLPDRPRMLWVDAICINQDDLVEKSTQIPLMSRIYTTASGGVLVWLGEKCKYLDLTISWIQTYVKKDTTLSSSIPSPWLALDAEAETSVKGKRKKYLATKKAHIGLLDFETHPYWRRMWTFQEFRLPKTEPLCVWGPISFPTDELHAAKQALDSISAEKTLVSDEIQTAGNPTPERKAELTPKYEEVVKREGDAIRNHNNASRKARSFKKKLLNALTRAEKHSHAEVRYIKRVEELSAMSIERRGNIVSGLGSDFENAPIGQGHKHSLLDLLSYTRNRQCFNPRDKIYAIYGLLSNPKEVEPPDYTKAATRVMQETTAKLINNRDSASIVAFSLFAFRDGGLTDPDYASWVLDFSPRRVWVPLTWRLAKLLADKANVADKVKLEDTDSATLHTSARYLGTCTPRHRFNQQDGDDPIPDQMYRILQQFRALDEDGVGARKLALVYHLVDESEGYSSADLLNHLGRGLTGLAAKCRQDWSSITENIAKRVAGKTLVEAGGRLGICPGSVREGDVVILPPAVRFPLVLRQERLGKPGKTSETYGPYYRIVGLAVFEGVCGKELDLSFVAKIERQALIQYLIH